MTSSKGNSSFLLSISISNSLALQKIKLNSFHDDVLRNTLVPAKNRTIPLFNINQYIDISLLW